MLELRDVEVTYRARQNFRAVAGVSLSIAPGETVGLVGESGSGKSSVAKTVVGLNALSAGTIVLDGQVIASAREPLKAAANRGLQLVFQDPRSSLNPRMTIGETLSESLTLGGTPRRKVAETRQELLAKVGLDAGHLDRYPHQLSGGQLQRVSIARALSVKPRYLILDEVTASLDVSVQARILNLLRSLQEELGFSMLYISHDLSVIRYVSDRVYVMRTGEIVEHGPVDDLFANPQTSYTRLLLDSVPTLGGSRWRREAPLVLAESHHPTQEAP